MIPQVSDFIPGSLEYTDKKLKLRMEITSLWFFCFFHLRDNRVLLIQYYFKNIWREQKSLACINPWSEKTDALPPIDTSYPKTSIYNKITVAVNPPWYWYMGTVLVPTRIKLRGGIDNHRGEVTSKPESQTLALSDQKRQSIAISVDGTMVIMAP